MICLMFQKNTFCLRYEVFLFVANFSSPSLLPSAVTTCALKCMGQTIAQNPESSIGVLISPVFGYKNGTLFNEEFALLKSFANSGCNVDNTFQLLFDPRSKTESYLSTNKFCFYTFLTLKSQKSLTHIP